MNIGRFDPRRLESLEQQAARLAEEERIKGMEKAAEVAPSSPSLRPSSSVDTYQPGGGVPSTPASSPVFSRAQAIHAYKHGVLSRGEGPSGEGNGSK